MSGGMKYAARCAAAAGKEKSHAMQYIMCDRAA
jgi:hypothetical protein